MSKKKYRRKLTPNPRRNSYSRRRIALTIVVFAVFMATGVILAQQVRNGRRRSTVSPASTAAGSPLKEYVFVGARMVATEEPGSGSGSLPAPINVVATASSTTQVAVTWSASAGAANYIVQRQSNVTGSWQPLSPNPTTTIFTDRAASPSTTYLYRVIAVDSLGKQSQPSNSDIATTIIFLDDPLIVGSTVIKAQHILDLRAAVNAARAAANLPTITTWTDPSPAGATVKAVHINEIRSNMTPAIQALTGRTPNYTNTLTAGVTIVKAVDVQEIRTLVK